MNIDDKRKIKVGIAISGFTILFYLGFQNFDTVMTSLSYVINLFSAFIIGLCFAFVLNLLMIFFENRILSHINIKKHPKLKRMKRPIAVVLTIIVFLGIVSALISFIIPQLTRSVQTLVTNFPSYLKSLEIFIDTTLKQLGISANVNDTVTKFLASISKSIVSYIGNAAPKIFQVTKSITSGILNTFLGFIIGIYMLIGKETLLKNSKRCIYAFMPKKAAEYTNHVYRIVKSRFSGFVTGQLTEALILSILCFIGMSIFHMEYALLISVIIGVTNMVPIIGPIIGAVPGALIMLMINPMKALWFIIFIIILQQLESNLIYPKVVGDSIGLPGIWVLFAILIGGSLFGLPGVLLGVPTFAVIYALISESTQKRLKKKNLQIN